jgi:UDPglucose--hexose-1-phosphate uridylyltransferase
MLSEILLEMEGDEKKAGWRTRVIPNKFPALVPEGNSERFNIGIYVGMAGYGRHEVLIESPHHNRDIAQMSREEVRVIIETYHKRYVDLMEEHRNMMTLIFRNHGPRAGSSLIHPHSQIIVTGMVPHYIRWREEEAQRYFDEWGRCVTCDILDHELQDRSRVILENDSFVAFVPFAAEVPFETWLVPRRHSADFGSIADAEKEDLSFALRDILARIHNRLNDPDYNYIINTSARYRANEPQLHWHLQIRPRLTTIAGFEIGSGISINPSLPEDDASFLKGERG